MPVSKLLSHVDARAESIKDIYSRRLSTGDMYAYAIHTISKYIDEICVLIIESDVDGYEEVVSTLAALMSKVESVVSQRSGASGELVDLRSTEGLDLALACYAVLRDGVSTMYRDHPGTDHKRTCAICTGLWLCAGVVAAVEQFLAAGMAQAKRTVNSVHGGQSPHRCTLQTSNTAEGMRWHVICPTCGVVAELPMNQATKASEAAIRHRRSRAGAPTRGVKGR